MALLHRTFSKLSGAALTTALQAVPTWKLDEARPAITKAFAFEDFGAAWRFMGLVAGEADKKDHHPEWFNVYNRVEVTLTTHDAGGITAKDLSLAAFMDKAEALVSHK